MKTHEPGYIAEASDTEFGQKQANLAKFLHDLYYGAGSWEREAEEEDRYENYMADAADVLLAMPHLFTLDERERLEAKGYAEFSLEAVTKPRNQVEEIMKLLEPIHYNSGLTACVVDEGQDNTPAPEKCSHHFVPKIVGKVGVEPQWALRCKFCGIAQGEESTSR